jgi:anti-sigma factor RsiW
MSNPAMRHPTDDQLLRFADGELPDAHAGEIRGHLSACWQCRTELEEIERTIGECVRYRKIVLDSCLPPPPAPWFDIYGRLAGIDASSRRPHLARRILESLAAALRSPSRWVPATAIIVLIAFVVEQFRLAPSVKAAELLTKAVASADSRPPMPRRIQIRTRAQRLTRVVGSGSLTKPAAGADSMASLESLFRAAHYSWEDPLSAKSFSEWRDQLTDKQDEVTSEGDRYKLRTTTGSGELVEATLELSSQDLRAVEGTLQFRNRERVEISELPDVPASNSEALKEAAESAPVLPTSPPKPDQAGPPRWATTPGEELQVMAVLHRLGADLGDPIEVTGSGGHILVTGMGIAPERQQEIRDELKAMPRVTLLFPPPSAEAPGREGAGASSISVSPGGGPWQAELEKQLGGRAAFEQFSDQVLQLTDAFMARGYALRRLAERFPPDRESQMTLEQRHLLATLCREHTEALLQNVIKVQGRLQPVLTMGVSAGATQEAARPATWQDGAEQLARAARYFETSLVSVLGGAAGENRSPQLMAELVESLTQLRNQAENYERLTPVR